MTGDLGTVVYDYEVVGPAPVYEVEFLRPDGTTIEVVTLEADAVRPFTGREIANARVVA